MGIVKQALGTICKLPLDQLCNEIGIANIWNRYQQQTTVGEEIPAVSDYPTRVLDVFEYISTDDAVIQMVFEANMPIISFKVENFKSMIMSLGYVGFLLVMRNSVNGAGFLLREVLAQRTGSGANIQNP